MKKFLILLSVLFCGTVFAETITINWGVDNQPYTTTTCEVGGDVVLPPVSKRGHIFRGWTPEHFDRGTFADWGSVPTDATVYSTNQYNNHIPKQGDYITIENVNDYPVLGNDIFSKEFTHYLNKEISSGWSVANSDGNIVIDLPAPSLKGHKSLFHISSPGFSVNNSKYMYSGTSYWGAFGYGTYSYSTNFPQNTSNIRIQLHKNDNTAVTEQDWNNLICSLHILETGTYQGTWKFVYDGVWEIDGKNGWKPDVQIISE